MNSAKRDHDFTRCCLIRFWPHCTYFYSSMEKMDRVTLNPKGRHIDNLLVTGCTEVVILTTSGATSDEKVVNMTTFCFQYMTTAYVIRIFNFIPHPSPLLVSRVCSNGVCDGESYQSETEECNFHKCTCLFTEDSFGPISTNPPLDQPVGWIESDGEEGVVGDSEMLISIGDSLAIGDVVSLQYGRECGFWWE